MSLEGDKGRRQSLETWEEELSRRERLIQRRERATHGGRELTIEDVREAARTAAQEVLVKIGVDVEEPLEMQKDFQHVREWRLASEGLKQKTMWAIITVLVTGLLGALFLGLRQMLERGTGPHP